MLVGEPVGLAAVRSQSVYQNECHHVYTLEYCPSPTGLSSHVSLWLSKWNGCLLTQGGKVMQKNTR
jgi:hypothetical protein